VESAACGPSLRSAPLPRSWRHTRILVAPWIDGIVPRLGPGRAGGARALHLLPYAEGRRGEKEKASASGRSPPTAPASPFRYDPAPPLPASGITWVEHAGHRRSRLWAATCAGCAVGRGAGRRKQWQMTPLTARTPLLLYSAILPASSSYSQTPTPHTMPSHHALAPDWDPEDSLAMAKREFGEVRCARPLASSLFTPLSRGARARSASQRLSSLLGLAHPSTPSCARHCPPRARPRACAVAWRGCSIQPCGEGREGTWRVVPPPPFTRPRCCASWLSLPGRLSLTLLSSLPPSSVWGRQRVH